MTAAMYLPVDQWSPRFDSTFFSVKIESAQKHERPLVLREGIGGKINGPAVYYDVAVFCEHRKIMLQRRYSNFYWLYEQVKDFRPPHVEGDIEHGPLEMPPGTCFWQRQDEEFIKNRTEQLGEFVDDLLSRPHYAEHPAVRLFFDLDILTQEAS
jgi:hypothetical protein